VTIVVLAVAISVIYDVTLMFFLIGLLLFAVLLLSMYNIVKGHSLLCSIRKAALDTLGYFVDMIVIGL
jgi:hypothetical protein